MGSVIPGSLFLLEDGSVTPLPSDSRSDMDQPHLQKSPANNAPALSKPHPRPLPTIVQATPDDAEIIVQNTLALGEEGEHASWIAQQIRATAQKVLNDPSEGVYLLARDHAGNVVGQTLIQWPPPNVALGGQIALLDDVYVQREWRGQGVIDLLLSAAKELGCSRPDVIGFRLIVQLDNPRAQRAYLRHGFVPDVHIVMGCLFPK